jgi:predicted nucleotidyltransferase component of viral defense system
MNPVINTMLSRYTIRSQEDANRALREVLQEVCLLGIWRAKLFEKLAFYGGTALRILYGLDRFSEDLDFSLLKPDSDFRWDRFAKTIEMELSTYGFEVDLQEKKKSFSTAVKSAFLKTNTLIGLLNVGVPASLTRGLHPDTVLRIKIEVDTDPVIGFRTKNYILRDPVSVSINTIVLSDLFASKMHAALFRAWKNRTKGRDWYDVVWYIRRGVPVSLTHFKQCLKKNASINSPDKLTSDSLKEMLHERIDNFDLDSALVDIRNFINHPEILDSWNREFFHSWIKQLTVEEEHST